MSVQAVEVTGANSVRPAFLKAQFKDILQQQQQSQNLTLPDVITKVDAVASRLERFGVFRNVKASISVVDPLFPAAASSTTGSDVGGALGLKVDMALDRANPHPVYLKTIVQDDLAGLVAGASLTNIFGGAESVSAEAAIATNPQALKSVRVDVTSPVNGDPDTRASVAAYSYTKPNPWASHSESRTGLTAKLVSAASLASLVEAGFGFEQRSVTSVAEGASDSVKALAGAGAVSNKAAVFARLAIDRQNDATYPTDGYAVELETELAGVLGGSGSDSGAGVAPRSDVSYLKTAGAATFSKSLDPVHDSLVFSASVGSGLLWSYQKQNDKRASSMFDRFFLGGKSCAPLILAPNQSQLQSQNWLYGYQHNGLGPKDGPDSIGGDAYSLGSLSFTGKLPRLASTHPLSPLRFQLFFSGASLVPIANLEDSTSKNGLKPALMESFSTPSTCAGAGLVYKTGPAQVEVVYSVPLRMRDGADWGRRGVQVTAGLELDF